MKMNNYLSDIMVDKFKILILYVIKDIGIIDIRKIELRLRDTSVTLII